MLRRIQLALTCVLLVQLWGGSAESAVPVATYGHLPSLENVVLSPDGSRIAFVHTKGDSRLLVVVSLADNRPIGGLELGQQKLRAIRWADNDRLLITVSKTAVPIGLIGMQHEWGMLLAYDITKRQGIAIPDPAKIREADSVVMMNTVWGPLMVRRINGHTVVFAQGLYVTHETTPALFSADLDSGVQRLVREGSGATNGWVVDDGGQVIAEEDYWEYGQRWALRIRRGNRLEEVASGHAPIEHPELLGFGPSTDTLLVQGLEDGKSVWRLLSLKDSTLGPPLRGSEPLSSPIEDWVSHRMVGGIHIKDTAEYVFFDQEQQTRWNSIRDAFPDEQVELLSYSADFSMFVVLVTGERDGYSYKLVNMNTHRSSDVGDVYDGLTAPLPTRAISYAAADGLTIPGYLTLPHGRATKGLPLIVFPHGGPEARDTADFDWWTQAMADQGYAVLQPNYRGSTVTRQHLEAGYGQWGRKMQTDLSDGVRYLVKEGIVDPARVCIVGASYGGYAALAGVTLDAEVYKCAVSVAGMSDLKRMMKWETASRGGEKRAERYWDRYMGVSGPNDPALDEISPIKHIDAVKVPVLLIHGKDDTVVPFEQSKEIYDALRKAKKQVELVTLEREDHWLSRSSTRLQMLEATVAFLRAQNPPGP